MMPPTRHQMPVIHTWLLWLVCFTLIATGAPMVLAAGPASRPAEPIRTWFEQLADRDAEVREHAIENLMGLTRDDLPALRKIVEASGSLRPSQTAVLRDIVAHVYIAGIDYPSEIGAAGFLGLSWNPRDEDDWGETPGVVVTRRVPGFAAYRRLRDGDLITGIAELPQMRLDNSTAFGAAVRNFRAGQTITLHVLRDGKKLDVPVELRPRPANVDGASLDMWIEQRQAAADQYWTTTFGPIIGDGLS